MNNQQPPIVRSLIAPLENGYLVLPLNLMAELVLVEQILQPLAIQGLQGLILWRNLQVPLINISQLCQKKEVEQHNHSLRCIVLRTVSELDDMPFIALRIQGIPSPLDVGDHTLIPESDQDQDKDCQFIASYARVTNLSCMIPDLPALEMAVYEQLLKEKVLGKKIH